ncbi:hypothetical protein MSMTP_2333 [Methanosarcina sp. MTP4]|uniref:Tc toxin subunit A-related protein n=1 Tax=Methanosarcina sp. MTP4 TaxID=1434100 RepID=UPI000615EE24|nr:LamG-like jellyroll fold domain-containing protein [Methanosarcina sp. MTP4]AKB25802.1 hypothetical protein MSMTP_2333 [Methanosarcina sp. MTP4]
MSTSNLSDIPDASARRLSSLMPEGATDAQKGVIVENLRRQGIDSAHAINRVGSSAFVSNYAKACGGVDKAKKIYEKASHISATTMALLSRIAPQFNNDLRVSRDLPDWEELFGSLDLCRCKHCESVYGPAAYLVDILHFLKDHPEKGKPALDVLFRRRPDIGEIELTCTNTLTTLPYVDLVNEILENSVSPPLTGDEPDLAGYWQFEQNGATDQTPNKNSGKYLGKSEIVDSPIPGMKALKFDGTNHVKVDNFDWPNSGPVTVEFYARVEAKEEKERFTLLCVGEEKGEGEGQGQFIVHCTGEDNHISFSYNDAYGSKDGAVRSKNTFSSNEWCHFAVVSAGKYGSPLPGIDGKARMALYINGELEATSEKSNGPQLKKGLKIGLRHSFPFKGQLAYLRIWERALSKREIWCVKENKKPLFWTPPLTGDEPGLAGYWQFKQNGATDQTPNKNSGKYLGKSEIVDSPIPGMKALKFDGTNHVKVDNFDWSNSGPVTVEFYARVEAKEEKERFTLLCVGEEKGEGEGQGQFIVHCTGEDNHISFSYNDAYGSKDGAVRSKNTFSSNEWCHFAVVSAGKYGSPLPGIDGKARMALYINGELEATSEKSNGPQLKKGLKIGLRHSFPFKGQLAYLRIWERALSKREIGCVKENRAPMLDWQTSWTADELKTNPEHLNPAAYDVLKEAVYPFDLPFDLWHEQSEEVLEHLGVPRHQIMRTFQSSSTGTTVNIAADHLGLTALDLKIITGKTNHKLWEFWGVFEREKDPLKEEVKLYHLLEKTDLDPSEEDKVKLSLLLKKAGLDYEAFSKVLDTDFVNPGKTVRVTFGEETDNCDICSATVRPVDDKLLDRFHRFCRLQRKLGWTARELDKAIKVFAATDLDDRLLISLSQLEGLRSELEWPVPVCLSWWSEKMDTAGDDSLYEKVFLDKAVDISIFRLNQTRDELEDANKKITNNKAAVLGALGIRADDFSRLVGTKAELNLEAKLNLENLTRMYKIASLSRALRLTVREFLALKALTGVDPFEKPESTLRFMEIVSKINDSKFDITDLDYLLCNISELPGGPAPSDDMIAQDLSKLRENLQRIEAERGQIDDPNGQLTLERLEAFWQNDLERAKNLDTAKKILEDAEEERKRWIEEKFKILEVDVDKLVGESALTPGEARYEYLLGLLLHSTEAERGQLHDPNGQLTLERLEAFWQDESDQERTEYLDTAKKILESARDAPSEDAQKKFIEKKFKILKVDVDQLVGESSLTSGEARYEYLLGLLLDYGYDQYESDQIMEDISEIFKLDATTCECLLEKLSALEVLLNLRDKDKELTSAQFEIYKRLYKSKMIVEGFGISSDELSWIFEHGDKVWFDLNRLPPLGEPLEKTQFEVWERLLDLLSLRDSLPEENANVFALIDLISDPARDISDKFEDLKGLTGWNSDDLEILLGGSSPVFKFKDTGTMLVHLKKCFDILNRLGTSAEVLLLWVDPDKTPSEAKAIVHTLRSAYKPEEWQTVAAKLRNRLRERQRSALTAYLIGNQKEYSDTSEMFESLLIDVEMNPCMITSRLKQAISSAQLFVQRCLMNLEPEVVLSEADASEWAWMKNYRVWEANRKVFLYPENWIEPELRDDKSPIFKELENALMQGEMNDANAERALQSYLYSLDEVANLEIVGIHMEGEDILPPLNGDEAGEDILPPLNGDEPGLAGWWKFDENEAIDLSMNTNDGTYVGSPKIVDSPIPGMNALDFDGENDYVEVKDFEWPTEGPVTVEFWVKVNSEGNRGSSFSVGAQDTPNRFQCHLPWTDGCLYWDYGNIGANGRVDVDYSPHLYKWTHVALVSKGVGGDFMGVYLDGKLIALHKGSDGPRISLKGLCIGEWTGDKFKGQIANFRIWNRILTKREIECVKENKRPLFWVGPPLNGDEPGLVGYWKFDEKNRRAIDQTPNKNNGCIKGSPTSVDSPIPGMKALEFDGDKDYVEVEDFVWQGGSVTIEFWAKCSKADSNRVSSFFGLDTVCRNNPRVQAHMYYDKLMWDYGNGDPETGRIEVDYTPYLDKWTHIALVSSGEVEDDKQFKAIYLNGNLVSSDSTSADLVRELRTLRIGTWADYGKFKGQIANFRVWNRALSKREIEWCVRENLKPLNDHQKLLDNLHTIGRTRGNPHVYYHRQWMTEESYWTPWKQIDVQIEGDHLIPVVHNRRLYLIWPVFMEKPKKEQTQGSNPEKYYEIRLAWTEYRNGQWSGQKLSTQTIPSEQPESVDEEFYEIKDAVKTEVTVPVKGQQHEFCFEAQIFGPDKLAILVFRDGRVRHRFRLTDRGDDFVAEIGSSLQMIPTPEGTEPWYDGFESKKSASAFWLGDQVKLLGRTDRSYKVLFSRQRDQLYVPTYNAPFYFNQEQRTFIITPSSLRALSEGLATQQQGFWFDIHYHPFVGDLIKALQRYGIDGMLKPKEENDAIGLRRQLICRDFFNGYQPTNNVLNHPVEKIDFSHSGTYSLYNWELFFHGPLHIATKLTQEQRFEEAQRWFHFIFDPTDVSDLKDMSSDPDTDRFWQIKPFFRIEEDPIAALMLLIARSASNEELTDEEKNAVSDINNHISAWRHDPFNPHQIARLRTPAYQKTVVMKYLENLLSWGDNLFRQDTIETVNEATNIYLMASSILGRRPEEVDLGEGSHKLTFNELLPRLDEFSNSLVKMEDNLSQSGAGFSGGTSPAAEPLYLGPSLFFCIPRNEKLLSYWDTVDDRLFKIRHCMNIEGQVRTLALFEPAIDPGLLVRAAAEGGLAGVKKAIVSVPLPQYRYRIMVQKALELCSDVIGLGSALLSALEKKDSETIALLHSQQETDMLNLVLGVRETQVEEAEQMITALEKSKMIAEKKKEDCENQKISDHEKISFELQTSAVSAKFLASISQSIAASLEPIPEITIGAAGISSPLTITKATGGSKWAGAMGHIATGFDLTAQTLDIAASTVSTLGSWKDQEDEWKSQAELLGKEIDQIDAQIEAANTRLEIAKKERDNHKSQIKMAEDIDRVMRSKYTNQQLYDWMVSQISSVYFQAYQLAYDLAKRAERAYQFELCAKDSSFVQFGSWDSLKKGLLSGERLRFQLRRMDAAYLENNRREYEITKHISLTAFKVNDDPEKTLVDVLKDEGLCTVDLEEVLFDGDHPGHYMRRIKSVSLTMQPEPEPYDSVNLKLTMNENSLRVTPPGSKGEGDDPCFLADFAAIQSIVTSNGKDDSGLFQLDLNDDRYLPFEGAGVISKWSIKNEGSDLSNLADVILHIRYTARDGGN